MVAVVIVALAGAVVGGVLLGDFGGAVFGLVVGGVVGAVSDLAARVRTLERKLEARKVLEARMATETTAPRAHERETPPAEPPRVERRNRHRESSARRLHHVSRFMPPSRRRPSARCDRRRLGR